MDEFPKIVTARSMIAECDDTVLSLLHVTDNHQNFIGIWLDSSYKDNIHVFTQLTRIFNNLKSFDDACECISYIVNLHTKQKIYFIISSSFGRFVLPLINKRSEILFIYIICQNASEYDSWKEQANYNRIFVYNDNLLYQKILTDIANQSTEESCNSYKEILPTINLFSSSEKNCPIKNLKKNSIAFICFQLIIEILLRMSVTKNTKETMIKACKYFYQNDHEEEKYISEFESDYSSDKAIWWYTRPCFCYRLTNKVLNTQDPHWLYTFRLIITDMHNQLLELYEKSNHTLPKTILRGKVMPSSVVHNLQENINGLISINGFLSATTLNEIGYIYCSRDNPVREGYERVLFRLDVDDNIETKPFAFIKDCSAIPDENEVLFSAGTVWRIESVKQDKEALWHIRLSSSGEENQRCVELTNYLKEQIGDTPTLLTLGNFLSEIRDYVKADTYYKILLRELPKNHKDIGAIYINRGCLQCEQGAYDLAECYFNMAIETIGAEHPSSILIAQCNIEMARCESALTFESSSDVLQNTVDLITKSLSLNDLSLGKLYNNIGYIQYKKGQNEVAMKYYQQALNILLESTNRNPIDLSAVYNNIGVVHFKAQCYDDAKKHFQLAIESGLLLLSLTHPLDYRLCKK